MTAAPTPVSTTPTTTSSSSHREMSPFATPQSSPHIARDTSETGTQIEESPQQHGSTQRLTRNAYLQEMSHFSLLSPLPDSTESPDAGSNYYAYFVSFAAATGGFLFGYEVGIVDIVLKMEPFMLFFGTGFRESPNSPVIPILNAADLNGNIVASFLYGCVFGACIVWWMADYLGRRRSILLGSCVFAVGGIIQASSPSIGYLYFGRAVSGIAIGVLSMVVPVYISEVARTRLRGRMVSIQQLMITLGIFSASSVNAILLNTASGDLMWRTALAIQVLPGVLLMLILLLLPFSPRWLVNQGRDAEAVNVLAKLRSLDPKSDFVMHEYIEIRTAIDYERRIGDTTWTEVFKPGIRDRVGVGVLIQFFQQWTGINVIMYYAGMLLDELGYTGEIALLVVINSIVNVCATMPGMFLIEKVGRRRLLVFGGIGMTTGHLLLCLFTGLNKTVNVATFRGYAIAAVASIYTFVLSFGSTWGPVAWVYQSEIFPIRVRAKGTAIATVINWSMNAIIAKTTPLLLERVEQYIYLVLECPKLCTQINVYLLFAYEKIFAFWCIVMTIYAYYYVPETRGRALEEMDDVFAEHQMHQQQRSAAHTANTNGGEGTSTGGPSSAASQSNAMARAVPSMEQLKPPISSLPDNRPNNSAAIVVGIIDGEARKIRLHRPDANGSTENSPPTSPQGGGGAGALWGRRRSILKNTRGGAHESSSNGSASR
ncbi:hypothetical protein BJ742DRAFT_735786 [Cladochytrium replicatum]|nr:hypothetical protein BJ742DRAFT_735786 [Cladochytrium replicatum]